MYHTLLRAALPSHTIIKLNNFHVTFYEHKLLIWPFLNFCNASFTNYRLVVNQTTESKQIYFEILNYLLQIKNCRGLKWGLCGTSWYFFVLMCQDCCKTIFFFLSYILFLFVSYSCNKTLCKCARNKLQRNFKSTLLFSWISLCHQVQSKQGLSSLTKADLFLMSSIWFFCKFACYLVSFLRNLRVVLNFSCFKFSSCPLNLWVLACKIDLKADNSNFYIQNMCTYTL